ncbi:hypothetical protein FRC17_001015 [Serendipita sp. 399]|nr:hypothetical protein FRC17_001015 [Serendipita sp. 399]
MEDHFITIDDEGLGKRTYHEQHFFCAECGDPFLTPKQQRKTRQLPNGRLEVVDQGDDVGFTVYKGVNGARKAFVQAIRPSKLWAGSGAGTASPVT